MKRAAQPHAATDLNEARSPERRAQNFCCFTRVRGLCQPLSATDTGAWGAVCVCGGGGQEVENLFFPCV